MRTARMRLLSAKLWWNKTRKQNSHQDRTRIKTATTSVRRGLSFALRYFTTSKLIHSVAVRPIRPYAFQRSESVQIKLQRRANHTTPRAKRPERIFVSFVRGV